MPLPGAMTLTVTGLAASPSPLALRLAMSVVVPTDCPVIWWIDSPDAFVDTPMLATEVSATVKWMRSEASKTQPVVQVAKACTRVEAPVSIWMRLGKVVRATTGVPSGTLATEQSAMSMLVAAEANPAPPFCVLAMSDVCPTATPST